MKKLAMALGAAAVAVVSGCKDPDYRRAGASASQNQVKRADTTVAQPAPASIEVKSQCTCAPGTRHTSPCACGAADCRCIVEKKMPPASAPVVKTSAPQPEYTLYTVRGGDYLAKISKRFNVTIAAIKRLNNMSSDTIRIGQKLKIPGKVDVGQEPVAVKAKTSAPKAAKAKTAKAYTGATKEYVVKNGDTLGAIALAGGISVRQLKELNSLSSDNLRIGQKLKVPAEKVVKKPAATVAAQKPAEKSAPKTVEKPAVSAPAEPAAPAETASAPETPASTPAPVEQPAANAEAPAAPSAEPAAPATSTYVVQEGDDITGVTIRWGVSAAEIRALNNLGETDQLKPGQIIKLPAEVQQ